jgi:hypothetical protein
MRIPEISPTGQEPRRPFYTRTATVLATLALPIVYILTGMPAATAPALSLPGCAGSISDSSVVACGGECPGLCPCPFALKDAHALDV